MVMSKLLGCVGVVMSGFVYFDAQLMKILQLLFYNSRVKPKLLLGLDSMEFRL